MIKPQKKIDAVFKNFYFRSRFNKKLTATDKMLGFIIFLLAMAILAFCAAPASMTDRLKTQVKRVGNPRLDRQLDTVLAKLAAPQQ